MSENSQVEMERCLACNELLPREHGYKSSRKYCDKECYENRHMITLEREMGKPIKEILLKTLNETKSVIVASDMLGINK